MPISRRVIGVAGILSLSLCAVSANATWSPIYAWQFPPDYTSRLMQAVVLNPCQPGTPCGDAAAKKYDISPWKVLPNGGMAEVEAAAKARQRAGLGDYPTDKAAGIAATGYTPSPDVSALVKTQFIKQIDRVVDSDEARKIGTALASRDIVAIWTHGMAPNGLHPNDLADAIASYWILNWMMANHGDLTPVQAQAVRDQIRAAIVVGRLAALTNVGRQEVAELMMIQFVIHSAIYETAIKANDADLIAKLGDAAEQRFQTEMKIDLRTLALTDQGFALKR